MAPDDFIKYIGDTAGKVCAEYNLPASVCIAQAILESGWGKYCIGDYNYFGRKWGGWGHFETHTTSEYINGAWVLEEDRFQSYDSLEDAITDWCALICADWKYADALNTWTTTWDVEEFVRALAPIYATDPDYADKIISTIRANNLMKYDGWGDE